MISTKIQRLFYIIIRKAANYWCIVIRKKVIYSVTKISNSPKNKKRIVLLLKNKDANFSISLEQSFFKQVISHIEIFKKVRVRNIN